MASFWNSFFSGFAKNLAKQMLEAALAEALTQVHGEVDGLQGVSDEEKTWTKKGIALLVERLTAHLASKS